MRKAGEEMIDSFSSQMQLVRILANKAAYSGQKNIRVDLTLFLGILSRAEAWTREQKEKENGS